MQTKRCNIDEEVLLQHSAQSIANGVSATDRAALQASPKSVAQRKICASPFLGVEVDCWFSQFSLIPVQIRVMHSHYPWIKERQDVDDPARNNAHKGHVDGREHTNASGNKQWDLFQR